MRCTLPAGDEELSGQDEHMVTPAPEYIPIPHSVQLALPDEFFHVPAAHGVQGPPSDPVVPASHLQSVTSRLPSKELEFDGHAEHATSPGTSLYLPVLHITQASPLGPVNPATHLQSAEDVLLAGD